MVFGYVFADLLLFVRYSCPIGLYCFGFGVFCLFVLGLLMFGVMCLF